MLGGLVVGALAVEGLVRFRQWWKYGTFGKLTEFAVHEQSGLPIPIPGSHRRGVRIDSRGFRSPELEVPKPTGRIRIAFLGGSTTYCAEVSSTEASWPHLVCQQLAAAHPDLSFDYINAGIPGYDAEGSRANLEYRVAPLEPDILVIYHAVNDLGKITQKLAIDQRLFHATRAGWLERNSLAWSLLAKNLLIFLRARGEPEPARRLRFESCEVVAPFENSLTELIGVCKGVTPVVALVTFSTRVRATQSPAEQLAACNTLLYYMPYMSTSALVTSFRDYNTAIRRVAAKTGVILVDGEDSIPADAAHFADSVHLLDPGCRVMARRVAGALLGSAQLARLLRR